LVALLYQYDSTQEMVPFSVNQPTQAFYQANACSSHFPTPLLTTFRNHDSFFWSKHTCFTTPSRFNFLPSLQEVHPSSQSKRLQQLVPDASSDDEPQPPDVVADQLATWQQEGGEDSERLVNLMKEQVIMARAYTMLAQQGGDPQLARQLRAKRKELQKTLGEATGERGRVCSRGAGLREWRRVSGPFWETRN
jgi:hypothetical protein